CLRQCRDGMDLMKIESAFKFLMIAFLGLTLGTGASAFAKAKAKPSQKTRAASKITAVPASRVKTTTVSQITFSIQNWTQSFSQAVQKNQTSKIRDLLNFKKLEIQAIPDCVDCEAKNLMKK